MGGNFRKSGILIPTPEGRFSPLFHFYISKLWPVFYRIVLFKNVTCASIVENIPSLVFAPINHMPSQTWLLLECQAFMAMSSWCIIMGQKLFWIRIWILKIPCYKTCWYDVINHINGLILAKKKEKKKFVLTKLVLLLIYFIKIELGFQSSS